MFRHASLVVVMTAALTACRGDFPRTLPLEVTQAEADFGVSVHASTWTGDTLYFYSWNAGRAERLTVVQLSEEERVVWDIVHSAGGFGPLWHGSVPHEATVIVPSEPLFDPGEGLRYRVSVTHVDGRVAETEFTT